MVHNKNNLEIDEVLLANRLSPCGDSGLPKNEIVQVPDESLNELCMILLKDKLDVNDLVFVYSLAPRDSVSKEISKLRLENVSRRDLVRAVIINVLKDVRTENELSNFYELLSKRHDKKFINDILYDILNQSKAIQT